MTLVLASTSRYRRELLQRIDLEFACAAPRFDERSLDHRFAVLDDGSFALELAEGKARSLVGVVAERFILAADQIAVVHDPERVLLHKPETAERAVDQLVRLSGTTHTLTTAVVLLDRESGAMRTAVDEQRLTMRPFDRDEARRYVERHRPLDCVGSYRIEDAGIRLFERIEGEDFTGIIGLPLLAVCRLLRDAGLLDGSN